MTWQIVNAPRSAKCDKCGRVWSFGGPVSFDEARRSLIECGWDIVTVRGPYRESDRQVCPVCVERDSR